MKYSHAFLTVFIVFPLYFALAQSTKTTAPPVTESPHQTTEAELRATIAKLQPDSVVLEIDGKTATWRELYPHVQTFADRLLSGVRSAQASPLESIRTTMQKLGSRRMFALEAAKMGLHPSSEERKSIEEEIAGNLRAQQSTQIRTLRQYKNSLDMQPPNLLNVTYEEMMSIMALNRKLFSTLSPTEQEIDLYIRYKKSVASAIDGLNLQRRDFMKELAQDPELKTEEGFAKLAKEYSEGVEAAWGGELRYDFTREELADVNDMKEFNWKVGELTPMLETATAYRIMKVLRSIPPEKAGEPEKLRVAQILCGKIGDSENLDNREAIRKQLIPLKQKAAIDEHVYKMSLDYAVKTPLFPEGLWKKPEVSSTLPTASTPEAQKEK